MFGLWRKNRPQSEKYRLAQYVGDDTLLISSKVNLFVYLDGRDASLTPSLLRHGTWEPAIGAFIDQNLRPGNCFLDIGANIGFHALHAGQRVGDTGLVIAFEPQERLCQLIRRSISANLMLHHVHARRLAIGAEEGMASLGKFSHLTGSATLTPNQLIVERE
jgi:hypothetical protein